MICLCRIRNSHFTRDHVCDDEEEEDDDDKDDDDDDEDDDDDNDDDVNMFSLFLLCREKTA